MDTTLFERRLRNEWLLLDGLAGCNPGRITGARLQPGTIRFLLHGPSALPASDRASGCLLTEHATRIEFPVHFPAVPMEMFLETPVFHPNVHPETGFVCLWDRHRVSNTVEHALHKLAAMLSGHLRNTDALHVMQPAACDRPFQTEAMPLLGVHYDPGPANEGMPHTSRRRRLQ